MFREFLDYCERFAFVTLIVFASLALSVVLLILHLCSSEAEIASATYRHPEIGALVTGIFGLLSLGFLVIGYFVGPRASRRK